MPTDSSSPPNQQPGLKRALGLSALIIYGIILVQPTAPMAPFGAIAVAGKGHVVTAILMAMVAMLFTAISYGRMANAYPSAGSAYAYVSREIHPALGYFTGWSIIFDYVMNPIICVIWISGVAKGILPEIPYAVYAVFFATLFTGMNLRGIEASARTNTIIAVGLGVIIVLFLGAAARYLWLQPPNGLAGWTRPFYDPQTFSFQTVSSGAAVAVLTYIGFDGISTLSEEAHNPRRNILLATVLVCLITGILASIQVYTAQLVWPGTTFPDTDTAFCYATGKAGTGRDFQFQGEAGAKVMTLSDEHDKIAGSIQGATEKLAADKTEQVISEGEKQLHQQKIEQDQKNLDDLNGQNDKNGAAFQEATKNVFRAGGGMWLFATISFALLVANLGSGAGAHLGAGRLLYSMGRDNAIPRKFFGAINPRTRIPSNNIILVGVITLAGAFTINYSLGCELLNFGALIAFMGVNASAFLHYFVRGKPATFWKAIWNFLSPLLGFAVCAYLWWSLGRTAHIVGAVWLATGILYGAWRTSFFRKPIQFANAGSEE